MRGPIGAGRHALEEDSVYLIGDSDRCDRKIFSGAANQVVLEVIENREADEEGRNNEPDDQDHQAAIGIGHEGAGV
jgi:hypothetical protein